MTPEQQTEAVRCYLAGETRNSLAIRYKASRPFVTDMLHRHGIICRATVDIRRTKLPYGDVFASAETNDEAAYWVGFLMADGCISQQKHTDYLILQLASVDIAHIERLRDFIGVPNKITIIKPTTSITPRGIVHKSEHARLCIASQPLIDSLAKYGVVPRKSKTARVISLENNPHFWRGVIDGDGHMRFQQRAGHCRTAVLNLVGSELLVNQFRDYIRTFTDFNGSVYFSRGAWCIMVCTRIAARVIHHLYHNPPVALPRKLKTAEEIIAHYDGRI